MTNLRVICDVCGRIEVSPADLLIELDGDNACYMFTHCDVETRHPLGPRAQALLVAVGVRTVNLGVEAFGVWLETVDPSDIRWKEGTV